MPTKKPAPRRKAPKRKQVGTLTHAEAKRRNVPTSEMEPLVEKAEEVAPKKPMSYPRNVDLGPQLVWRGKDAQDYSDLIAPTPGV